MDQPETTCFIGSCNTGINVANTLQIGLVNFLGILSLCYVVDSLSRNNVIPVLADILRNSQKEKVTRIIIATYRVRDPK